MWLSFDSNHVFEVEICVEIGAERINNVEKAVFIVR